MGGRALCHTHTYTPACLPPSPFLPCMRKKGRQPWEGKESGGRETGTGGRKELGDRDREGVLSRAWRVVLPMWLLYLYVIMGWFGRWGGRGSRQLACLFPCLPVYTQCLEDSAPPSLSFYDPYALLPTSYMLSIYNNGK